MLAFEVFRTHANGEKERLGHVVELPHQGGPLVHAYVAYAALSATGDSFLGTYEKPRDAIQAIERNEKALERAREEELHADR